MSNEYLDSLSESEKEVWNTEDVFKPVSEWHEDDGQALFFKLDAGESPAVTSPISSDWIDDYYTHWMALPKEFRLICDYRTACIKSGVETKFR